QYIDDQNRLTCLTLDPSLEKTIVDQAPGMAPRAIQELVRQLEDGSKRLAQMNHTPVVLCSPPARAAVRRFVETSMPRVAVLSFTEVTPDVSIESMGCIGAMQEPARQGTRAG